MRRLITASVRQRKLLVPTRGLYFLSPPRDMDPMRMAVPIDPEERALLETIVEAGPFPPDSRTGPDRAKGETGNPSLASDVGKKTQLTEDKANASGGSVPGFSSFRKGAFAGTEIYN